MIDHTGGRAISKLDHLPQRDTGCGEVGIVPDGFHQALRGLPHGVEGPKGQERMEEVGGRALCVWGRVEEKVACEGR